MYLLLFNKWEKSLGRKERKREERVLSGKSVQFKSLNLIIFNFKLGMQKIC